MHNPRSVSSFVQSYWRILLIVFGLSVIGITAGPGLLTSEAALQAEKDRAVKSKRSNYIPGEVLVRFKQDSDFAKSASQSQLQLFIDGRLVPVTLERTSVADQVVPGLRLARVAPDEMSNAIATLKARPDVLYAEPNLRRYKQVVPNDARYSELWGLKNTGQNAGTPGADIDAEIAWNTTTGSSSVVVGVVDEGIDTNHPDLLPNIWQNPGETAGNNIDDDGNGFVDDVRGFDFFHNDGSVYDGPGTNPDGSEIDAHGTHVAGTIGAVGNNGQGVVGVNWQVKIISLKFLGPEGGSTTDLLKALNYAKMMKERWVSTSGAQGANIRVLNNSYGGTGFSQAEFDAIKTLDTAGILFVVSAGNEGTDSDFQPDYPASYFIPNIISVAASNRREGLANFSNRGSLSVHLAAPGVEVLSTVPGNAYEYFDGTSMAAPHVTGTAALILAANPSASTAKLKASILFGAEQVPAFSSTITGARLNMANALQSGLENDTTAPAVITSLHIAAQDDRNVTLNWTAPGDDGNSGQASFYEVRFVDQVTSAHVLLAYKRPAAPGSSETLNINIPFRHPSGSFLIRTFDNVGNVSDSTVNASVTPANLADAYSVALSAQSSLSTGGSQLFMQSDDRVTLFGLPFNFPYFDRFYSVVALSTNGAMYFDGIPPHDVPGRSAGLNRRVMIAAAWDDLDLRTCARADSDIFRVIPDPDRVIYRWQGVVFEEGPCNQPPANPKVVNFEVELRRDGTIIKRYGQNSPLGPVVGIGGGEPESYLISSHTSETAPLDLTNAQTITYTLQRLPKTTDLGVSITATPQVSMVGQTTTWNITANNLGPSSVVNAVLTDTLPGFTDLVSCTTSQGTCTQSSALTLKINTGPLSSGGSVSIEVVGRTTLGASSPYTNSVNISSNLSDLTSSNNATSITTEAAQPNLIPQTGLVKIGAGSSQSFAIRNDGNGLGWGWGQFGQIGDGGLSDRKVPVRIVGVGVLTQIDGGIFHTIALRSNGAVWAWGRNDKGQLGNGTTLDNRRPAVVPGLSGITQISAGGTHNLALKSDGTVWAWGDNSSGQLGDGSNVDRLSPIQIPNLSNVTVVAAGINHSLVLKNDGTVWSFGANESGQLGIPVSTGRNVPAQVNGISNVTSIAAGDGFQFFNSGLVTISYSAVIRSDGTIWTWGSNWRGQLGDGTMTDRSAPGQVQGINGVTAIATGGYHMLALRNDGSVWSWGGNFRGQCGDTTLIDRTAPVKVVWLTGITAIAAGHEHSLALRSDGHLFGFGSYDQGQLGFGDFPGSRKFPYEVSQQTPDPLPVGALDTPTFSPDGGTFVGTQNVVIHQNIGDRLITSYLAGGQHVVAKLTDGSMWGWGNNHQGQLGFDAGQPHPDPLKQDVKIPVPVVGFDGWTSIVADETHNIGLKSDGTVWTWGGNEWGELGYTTNGLGFIPKQVPGISGVVSIAAKGSGSLAVKSDGTVWRWGFGLITGPGDSISRMTPVQVAGLSGISKAAESMNFVVKGDGTVWGWGKNDVGQLGIGNQADSWTPVQVLNLSGVVSAGSSVALKSNGTVWTWGWNLNGRLGTGAPLESVSTLPQQVPISNVVAIAPGGDHCIALKSDGTVWGWGSNINGKLGDGTQFNHFTPFQIPGLSNITAIAVGREYSTALRSDGTLFLWGKNEFGQIGDGSLDSYFNPTPMSTISGGVSIHYTTNGSDPTENDPEILSGAAVPVGQSVTLKARAFKDGWTPSGTKSASFTISIAPNIQLNQSTYTASEGDAKIDITVTRTGDTSINSSINYTTNDAAGSTTCNVANGKASALCDYITKTGKLNFAPGESSKTFSILLIDDGYAEGVETFNLALSDPSAATLNSPVVATITINDNDAVNGSNPMDAAGFFVRQHYLDFLNREPDPSGLAFWTSEITSCGLNSACIELKRINVSAAFFLSIEFQETGYLVYRLYKSSFGNLSVPPAAPVPVKFLDFLRDSQEISKGLQVGAPGWEAQLEANKQAFALAFVQRLDFQAAFPNGMSSDQFVTKLDTNAGGVLSPAEKSSLVAALNVNPSDQTLRAATLRAVAEDADLRNAERSRAFVLMQYFGYLRRNPNDAPDLNFDGYNFWLTKLNQFNGNFIQAEMVKAFISAIEYRQRFGP